MAESTTPFLFSLTENYKSTTLLTAGKYCDRDIVVTPQIDESAIRQEGIETGEAVGRQEAYNEFWDAYQTNGTRTSYEMAFAGEGWDNTIYKPKYPIDKIKISKATRMYNFSKITGHIAVDTSECTAFDAMFSSATGIESIGTIDTRKSSNTQLAGLFGYMSALHTIEKLILKEDGTQTFSDSLFDYDTKLANIAIEGVIGNNLNMRRCQSLTQESATSIIDALSTTASGKTLTLSTQVRARFTDAEWSVVTGTKQNWTISLV